MDWPQANSSRLNTTEKTLLAWLIRGLPIGRLPAHPTTGSCHPHVTETVYRHVIVLAIHGGAAIMESVFDTRANVPFQ